MWPTRQARADQLDADLQAFSANQCALPGIADPVAGATLVKQMIASLRRLDYSHIIGTRDISPDRADPQSQLFDPEKAAVLHFRAGRLDEAFWLVFLITHFGKSLKHGWRMLREVYLGSAQAAGHGSASALTRRHFERGCLPIRGISGVASAATGSARASGLTFLAAPPPWWRVTSPG